MIDINVLVKPLLDLLSSFGSGVLPSGGPSDALVSASTALEQLHQQGRASINQMNSAWDGVAADAATAKALRVQTSAATISDRGTEMATVVNQAAAQVETGQKDLNGIVQSFVNTATALGPTLATPQGLTVLVGSAIEHLNQGLAVVGRVRSELDTQTAAITQLTPPPSTPPVASLPGALAGGASSGLQGLMGVVGQAGSLATTMASTPLKQVSKAATTGTTPSSAAPSGQNPNSSTSTTATTDGVKITLPDGSVVEAPNEKAATAVQAAIGAVGTPYVWGGNDPGSGIDCSGLTKYAYGEAGVELPRLAQEQHIGHPQVSPGDLMPGDLAVWDGHVAMVIGNGQLVEAGDPVSISSIRTENMGMEFYGFYRPTA
ncbi:MULTISPECIES: C40 family peptidase [Nocardia]|uniref:Probable endopeptidase p60 n=1 Tax=Nocardia farcinica TaxID=37329 RepID=A0A449H8A8_NOCFR|nr:MULTISPECIES: C40 family peptidase [Nocardia]MBF6069539.1 C40 family peptidase [Nocardia farcinica]MBF6187944.1 C40 family peptidase [Nocardia farcinica]MBF6246683.1 C40 family peptidase [Nocardia elegans]MBF6314354.1 C40 family peptidase [Nocardia farcinica]MBF6410196.1 C40 family peptidase [Nocardia farcinica]